MIREGSAIGTGFGIAIGAALEQNREGTSTEIYGAEGAKVWILVGLVIILVLM